MPSAFLKSAFAAALLGLALTSHAVEGAPKVVKKVPPVFPDDVAETTSGVVKARLSIDAQGNVTDVTVIEAQPQKLFDRAASSALRAWRFEPTGKVQTFEVKLVFVSDN